jgi:HSP20 family protein
MSVQDTKIQRHDLVDREFNDIRELLEMLMSELRPTKQKMSMRPNLGFAPPTDAYETPTEFVVTMTIAGMRRDQISVITDGQILTIQGIRDEIAPKGKKQFYKLEIQVGPFQRHIQIPVPVDSESISTNYSNGLLEVRLKKTFEKTDRREIDVE